MGVIILVVFRCVVFSLLLMCLSARADLDEWTGYRIVNEHAEHLFIAACRGGYYDVALHYFKQDEFKPNEITSSYSNASGLYLAAQKNNSSVVQLFVNACNGIKKDRVNFNEIWHKTRMTSLAIAVTNGHTDTVEVLLKALDEGLIDLDIEKGVDAGGFYISPLCIAAEKGFENLTKLLVDAKANLNKKHKGLTPLHIASKYGHLAVVERLLEGGDCINKADEYGQTPLYNAVVNKEQEVVNFLLSKNADVNAAKSSAITPLHAAVLDDDANMVTILLMAGARCDLCDSNGDTPCDIAIKKGAYNIQSLLLQHGKSIVTAGFSMTYKEQTPQEASVSGRDDSENAALPEKCDEQLHEKVTVQQSPGDIESISPQPLVSEDQSSGNSYSTVDFKRHKKLPKSDRVKKRCSIVKKGIVNSYIVKHFQDLIIKRADQIPLIAPTGKK